jgi:hypothetical protein
MKGKTDTQQRGKPVIEIKHSHGWLAANIVPFASQPLRDGPPPPRQATPAIESGVLVRHFGSNAANSRLPGVLPGGTWKVKWSAVLTSAGNSVIRADDRILCQSGEWWLFDATGKQLATQYAGPSPLVIDERTRTFQFIVHGWQQRWLSNGEVVFENAVSSNERTFWPVLFRNGNRMIAFANVEPEYWNQPPGKSSAFIEMCELETPFRVDDNRNCRLKGSETLTIAAENARAAAVNDLITMAAPDVLIRFDSDLKVVSAFTGHFIPKQISLDESGWACIYVEVDRRPALWLVTPEGVRVLNWPAPVELGEPIQAPIIGYDRRMYLLSKSHLVAVDPQGKTLWMKPVPSPAVGAGVTINGRVLVSAGAILLAYAPDGQASELLRFSEELTSPPIITSHHEILLCMGKKLHCLVARA